MSKIEPNMIWKLY